MISRVRIGDAVYFPRLDDETARAIRWPGAAMCPMGPSRWWWGEGAAGLQSVTPPASALDAIRYRRDWDLSDPTRLPQLRVSFTAEGLAAEALARPCRPEVEKARGRVLQRPLRQGLCLAWSVLPRLV